MLTPQKIIKTITIKPGEQFIVPENSKVVAVVGTATSNCTLPAEEAFACYTLQWEIQGTNPGDDAWEQGTIDKVFIGTTQYPISYNAAWENGSGGLGGLQALFNQIPTLGGASYTITTSALRKIYKVEFQSIPSIADNMSVQIFTQSDTYVQVKPQACPVVLS